MLNTANLDIRQYNNSFSTWKLFKYVKGVFLVAENFKTKKNGVNTHKMDGG